jgi:hypothetical protein
MISIGDMGAPEWWSPVVVSVLLRLQCSGCSLTPDSSPRPSLGKIYP